MKSKNILKSTIIIPLILISFLGLYLTNLGKFPVFADEAIYIRWAQLINQDFDQYKFFSIQDGKPPLHMLLLTRFLPLYPLDPLYSSRLMSIITAGLTALILWKTVKLLSANKSAQYATAFLTLMLPFSLFHYRLGLIDPLLTLLAAITFYSVLKIIKKPTWTWYLFTGLSLGAGLWTKTSILMLLPTPLIFILQDPKVNLNKKMVSIIKLSIPTLIGLSLFLVLKIDPSFPALFSRSQDFTFSISEVLSGQTSQIISNISKIGRWSLFYFTLGGNITLIIAAIIGLKRKRLNTPITLLLCTIIFLSPFIVFGKVNTPRYFLPSLIFIIPSITLTWQKLWKIGQKNLVTFLVIITLMQSIWFAVILIGDYNKAPLPKEDRIQYLEEWSSGHGIKETRDYISTLAQHERATEATEGYFGTLPDGLLMYFDKAPEIKNLEIYGIGQPIRELSKKLFDTAKDHATFVLVNEHRWFVDTKECCTQIASFPRPNNAPSLLLLQVDAK